LMLAVKNGYIKTAKLLLEAGADPDLSAKNGATPLMLAAQNGSAKMIELLVKHGVNLDLKSTEKEYTALNIAAHCGNLAAVKALIKHKANPDIKNKDGKMPSDSAKAKGHKSITRLLLSYMQQQSEQLPELTAARAEEDEVSNLSDDEKIDPSEAEQGLSDDKEIDLDEAEQGLSDEEEIDLDEAEQGLSDEEEVDSIELNFTDLAGISGIGKHKTNPNGVPLPAGSSLDKTSAAAEEGKATKAESPVKRPPARKKAITPPARNHNRFTVSDSEFER